MATAWNVAGGTETSLVSRSGLLKGGTDKRAIFLKQFSGEVLTSFEEKNIAMPLHRVRTISNGKSAQFPSIGTIGADYHTAGQTILGDSVNHGEITVTVDDLLVSSAFVPKIDEAMQHYEVRSTYSAEMGNALANAADKNIFATIYKASKTVAPANDDGDQAGYWTADDFDGLSGDTDGNPATGTAGVSGQIDVASVTASTGGQGLVDAVFKGLEQFDSHDVTGEKYLVVTPATYYSLFGANTNYLVNTAMNQDVGGNGSVALGNAPTIGGVKVLMSNHLPTADGMEITNAVNENGSATDYSQFNANLKGMLFTKDAAATVKLLDLGVESEYQIERQGTLMVAKYAMGHNVLRGKSAIALV
ncbi:MAG: hypothetical protein NZ730_09030 [Porticoccaceae bacterium]|nr:hypothetical protein [Porticoccaceae bacterium]